MFVPHGKFVSAVTSSGEIGCEANHSDRQHRKSPRPREVAGGYIDRDGAILDSPTENASLTRTLACATVTRDLADWSVSFAWRSQFCHEVRERDVWIQL